jgi:Uma2 family endonuclease
MSALRKPIEAVDDGAEERIVLYGVAWEEYERMLEILIRHPGTRLTYCEGALEIMVVSFEHEKVSGYINSIIHAIANEWRKDFVEGRSTTFKLKKRERGFEPDGCYYFTNVKQMRAKTRIDLTKDKAPDLAVEVDISNPSISRFPIFARLGVTEVWRYHKGQVEFFVLRDSTYVRRKTSKFLPRVNSQVVTKLVAECDNSPAYTCQEKAREYARELRPAKPQGS